MIAQRLAAPSGLNANELNFLVFKKIVENPDRIRSPAHARNNRGWQLSLSLQNLRPRLASNYPMKIPHHRRIWMRSEYATQQIMRRTHIRDPVAHGLIDRTFQSTRS